MPSQFTLHNTTVIINGAAGGLGKAIATAFLRAGANVAICDIHLERLQECLQEWGQSYERKFLAIKADVASEEELAGFFEVTIDTFGQLDIVINNAAILGDLNTAGTCSTQIWERVLAVNLTGSLLATRLAITRFEEQDVGKEQGLKVGIIINIGSEMGHASTMSGVAYTASKHGIYGLTENTASNYGPRGVSCVYLSLSAMVGTNIFDPVQNRAHAACLERTMEMTKHFDPEKHTLPLDSVAEYCLFLSDKRIAAASNGSCIELRGCGSW